MKLIELDTGNVSLEYSAKEAAAVKRRLRRAGVVSIAKAATYDVVSVGGMSFIAMNEWDEPCLISQSSAGAALLREIARPASDRRAVALG